METFLIRALQLILSLSLLVIIHEMGHFLFARLFKTRVEKFCLFFDPWFTLFKFKPKRSETEYAVGWLPLGGYVKISGMIDESMDLEQMKQPPQPLFNFLLALFIYSMILFAWGDTYIPVQKAPLGMDFNETMHQVGFQDGDVLISADGKPFERMGADLLMGIVDARQVTVLRDGKEASVYIPDGLMDRLLADSVRFADFRIPFVLDSLAAGSPAQLAGLLPGDSGQRIAYLDFREQMARRHEQYAQAPTDSTAQALRDITLTYMRQGVENTVALRVDTAFTIGVYAVGQTDRLLPVVQKDYSFFASFPAGVKLGVETLKGYVGQMKYLFSKEGAKQLGGFGAIGSIFPATWDWHQFWYMTAFLSIILAFMNILPIPALDGGHVLFLIYEIVARRKPSDKFMERAQMVGMFLLFALLIWANLNDVIRFLF